MNHFGALSDPARRRMVECLAVRDRTAGELGSTVLEELGVSQPAASRHLRVLRETGLVECRAEGTQRVYSLDREGVEAVGAWVEHLRALWGASFAALDTEIARGRRDRRPSTQGDEP